MKVLVLALCFVLAAGTPVRVEQEAEIAPDQPGDRNGRQFPILLRPFSLDDFFGSLRPPPVFTRRRYVPRTESDADTVLGGPDFVNVPATGQKPEDPTADDPDVADEDVPKPETRNPFEVLGQVFDDMRRLQEDLLKAIFRPLPAASPDQAEEDTEVAPVPPRRTNRPSFPDNFNFFGGFPAGFIGGLGSADRTVPSYGELPANYSNSTYREEEINGEKVQINETIRKHSHPFGESVFHVKVVQLKPDDEETVVQKPEEQVPEEQKPRVEVPLEVEGVRPAVINEPKEEKPVFKEDFGPINRGTGHDEQVPIRGADESLNEV